MYKKLKLETGKPTKWDRSRAVYQHNAWVLSTVSLLIWNPISTREEFIDPPAEEQNNCGSTHDAGY